MKNIFRAFFMTAMFCGFIACNNPKTFNTEQVETTVVDVEIEADSIVIDTATVDTIDAVTRGGADSEGFGRCLVSGCYCKEFEGRGQTCRNCGHAYKRHY